MTPTLCKQDQSLIREVVGVVLYYGRAIDNTMLVALGTIAADQSNSTEATMDAVPDLLNYAAEHPDATIRFEASDMILNIDADASYLSEAKARSRASAFFFLSSLPTKTKPAPLNGPVLIMSTIMRNVMASAAEAEVGSAFLAGQEGCPIRTTLIEMGHPQPATPMVTDNKVAKGIIEDTVKQKRSKAIDMRFYWIRDRVNQNQYQLFWRPGLINMGDYHSKHHPPSHHQEVRRLYLWEKDSHTKRAEFYQ